MKPRFALLFIIILTLAAVLVDLPKLPNLGVVNNFLGNFPLKLGLDLQGGTQLVLLTKMDKIADIDRDSALESARQVIEKRVNLYGVSEAVVQSSKVGDDRRILVELPGLKNASEAAQLVGRTAQLEFREISATTSAEATSSAMDPFFGMIPTGLTGADLTKAQVVYATTGSGGPQVEIRFTDEGGKKFAEITKRNVGKPLAMFLDGMPISWPPPVVEQEILGGSGVITGQFTPDEAKNLAVQLNAGALPVPITILEQRSVGPSLGQESINKSLAAGLIGLIIVGIFMAIYYGWLGLIADVALLIYTALVLAIFKTGLFVPQLQVTLTLAGIAGFILSIGMAVDANILIFERMKEEKRWGKSNIQAMELGFKRAWSSIWASNVSSLITALILYNFGSSLIKGFAITLAIGVLISMFTAIVVSRNLLRLFVK
jgi:preprotein translocase subunit SecD